MLNVGVGRANEEGKTVGTFIWNGADVTEHFESFALEKAANAMARV